MLSVFDSICIMACTLRIRIRNDFTNNTYRNDFSSNHEIFCATVPSDIDGKWIQTADTLYNTKNNLPETAGACIGSLLLFLNFAVTWKRKQIDQLIFSVVDPDSNQDSTRFFYNKNRYGIGIFIQKSSFVDP
jgi:hypothetical protein